MHTLVCLEPFGHVNEFRNPLLGFSHKNRVRQGHAALTGRSKRGANLPHARHASDVSNATLSRDEHTTCQLIKSGVLVGIWHDDAVVLGAHIGLQRKPNVKSGLM